MSCLQDFTFFWINLVNKFNNVDGVNTACWKFNFWRHYESVGSRHRKCTHGHLWASPGVDAIRCHICLDLAGGQVGVQAEKRWRTMISRGSWCLRDGMWLQSVVLAPVFSCFLLQVFSQSRTSWSLNDGTTGCPRWTACCFIWISSFARGLILLYFSLIRISMSCGRLSWPSRPLLKAR